MYSVSNAYKTDMKRPVQSFGIRGTIGSYPFTSDNILSGTFSITNQCTDNDELILGAAYVGELQAFFRGINIPRYEWVGKVITAYHIRYLPNDDPEEIPLGVFTIKEASWSRDGVSVVAYDNMSKLDKAATFNATSGSAYGILTNICSECGITFGMTQPQVEALPNGQQIFGCYPENDIETFRDMIAWLAQAMCSVVLIDRQGRLILKTYNMTSVDEIGAENRFEGASFADFESKYSGVSVVDIASKQTRYYHTEDDRFLTMNLGSNPFLQYGSKSTKDNMMNAILTKLASVSYVPFSATLLGDPVYDLCDVITNSGGLGDSTKAFCIQRYSWGISGGYSIEGVGKDPDLRNAKSKTDKQLAGIMNGLKGDQVQYYYFENSDQIIINDGKTKEILYLRFASLKNTTVIFHAEILLEADSTVSGIDYNDIVGIVTYYLNLVEVQNYYPTETWVDGKHVLHLLYHIPIQDAKVTRFTATLTADGGDIYIPVGGVQAIIHGQGLAATDEWDGFIDFKEKLGRISLGDGLRVRPFSAEPTFKRVTPTRQGFTETLGRIALGDGLSIKRFNADVSTEFEEVN